MVNAGQRELALLRFVKSQLLSPEGGVYTGYHRGRRTRWLAAGTDVLSESQGLLMEYALLTRDAALFAQALRFVEDKLLLNDAISYRYSEPKGRYSVNAAVDDFRIIRGLLAGGRVFCRPWVAALAQLCSRRLFTANVVDGHLVDFFEEDTGQPGGILTLCYADFAAMQQLGEHDPRWEAAAASSLLLVEQGYLGDAFPLFATAYRYSTRRYAAKEIATVQALLTALHLAQIGRCPPATVAYIRQAVTKGRLYGSYTAQGAPLNGAESTAVYALAAIFAKIVGDDALAGAALQQMQRFQIMDEGHALYGAYADGNRMEAFSFDNLCALLAYALMRTP